ncbi:MAG TPA: sugar transferase [Terracidiphilus sp.]|jgi:exopolysaccharide biosynthesis polyprenyl glycosylphosphotransferase
MKDLTPTPAGAPDAVRASSMPGSVIVSMLIDALIILLAFSVAGTTRLTLLKSVDYALDPVLGNWDSQAGVYCLLLFICTYIWIAHGYRLFSDKSLELAHELRMLVQSCLNAGLVLSGLMFMAHVVDLSREILVFLTISSAVGLCIHRGLVHHIHQPGAKRVADARNVVIVGTNQLSYALSQHLRHNPRLEYNVVGFAEFPGCRLSPEVTPNTIVGDIADLEALKRRYFVDVLVITEFYAYDQTLGLVGQARELGIDVLAISGYYSEIVTSASTSFLGIFPVSPLYSANSRPVAQFIKRIIDIVASSTGLFMAAIPMLLIALIIRLDSDGPAFYLSERIGRWGRPFKCLKFRTMVLNAEALQKDLEKLNERDGILFKLKNDPRITPVGRLLRKYSVDEVPQLINVLRGEMSLVGPRPPLAQEVAKYNPEYLHRLAVMPGLTGLWQVQARQDSSFTRYIALDMAYVKNWSLLLDFKILLRTVDVVLRGTGV